MKVMRNPLFLGNCRAECHVSTFQESEYLFYILVNVKLIFKSLKSRYNFLRALVFESQFQAKRHLFKHLCRQDFEAVLCAIIEGVPGKSQK